MIRMVSTVFWVLSIRVDLYCMILIALRFEQHDEYFCVSGKESRLTLFTLRMPPKSCEGLLELAIIIKKTRYYTYLVP